MGYPMDVPVPREDVVAYLQTHLPKFSVDDLREQLVSEGVSDAEFDEALKTARTTPAPGAKKRGARAVLAKLLLFGGAATVVLGAVLALSGRGSAPEKASGPPSAPATTPISAWVGKSGYVVRLPEGYTATQSFKDQDPRIEVVHFYKVGLDPTSLLDEGLYGPLGIVRLEVQPNPFPESGAAALEPIAAMATGKAKAGGEHFTIKNLQISSLSGIQLNFDAPNPRIIAYIVGENNLYTFYAGQDDETYRGILNSLRDTQSEN